MKLSKALQGFSIDRRAQGYSPATIKIYNSCLSNFSSFLGEIENITKQNLLEFFYYLRTDYKPRRFSGSTEPLSP
ncbi:MAG: phage integrase N-terminal SAM-like domain-containing protein, partial [Anaerolineales bacterium]|nr:phage integrase N-terminal SAM-like domain-containing protein [Anaerolineales bacterium]